MVAGENGGSDLGDGSDLRDAGYSKVKVKRGEENVRDNRNSSKES